MSSFLKIGFPAPKTPNAREWRESLAGDFMADEFVWKLVVIQPDGSLELRCGDNPHDGAELLEIADRAIETRRQADGEGG